ncbi:D-alanyl-D-alanine carboxypeptidase [Georhizobium profundi]|uniref:D-alanyl-D-alanine carboxypeptidase n=1 Tax=Georhizobium profundi TaxID=2341112 RepID=A0A3S9B928_9HYPH|nr:D-alanyl-D-alanine carboxypeptidase [Georhizobium profundi]AZN73364.1 D-alanyl-D-alanine carboxypeptidase [Georhizobium profundi]
MTNLYYFSSLLLRWSLVGFLFVFAVVLPGPTLANAKYAGIVVDARTGDVLYADRAQERRYPASLTKMMTLYLTFEALDAGQIAVTDQVPISRHAASEPPSKLGLRVGSVITVGQIMQALVTKSANDAATALGEFLGGSEDGFARLATAKAKSLGMSSTVFKNAHGLPDSRQVTTAHDMARLGLALKEHFPHHYSLFQTRSFRYGGQVFGSHNRLIGSVQGVDGIKTGFINASGFNLVSSVDHNGKRIVAVVMGGRTGASRDAHMRKLIAEYLPQASSSGSGLLIARTVTGGVARVATSLPIQGPIPSFRQATTTASANVEVAALDTSMSDVDTITTASTSGDQQHSDWVVQIGATPSESGALDLLRRAKGAAGVYLEAKTHFAVRHDQDGTSVYRARLGGFTGKTDAWETCGRLKSLGFACWATEQ